MPDDYEYSPIVPVGDKKYFCVEYPGYVKRTKRAIATLGGEKALSEALARESIVKLKYRPGDDFSHPIQGHIIPNSKLLVKVTRRVKRDKFTGEVIEEEASKWKTEIEGLVVKTLRFRALADFQYIVPKDDKIRQLRQALVQGDVQHLLDYKVATDDDDLENLRNIPPPIFTPLEGPLNYGYRQNAPVLRVRVRQPDGSFKIKLMNRSRGTGYEVTSIRFHEENAPTKSWHRLPESARPEEIEVIELVAQLFRDRPVWSRFAIKNKLASNQHPFLKTALVRNAYTFMDGPWRDCWIPYGKDPRKEPDWYMYQQVDIRRFTSLENKRHRSKHVRSNRRNQDIETVKQSQRTSETPEIVGPENKHIFDGKTVSGASSLFQLVDIIDPEITPLIHNPEYRKPKVSKYSGFYYNCALVRIRKILRAKHLSLLDTGKAISLPDIEDGLMQEILKEKEKILAQGGDEDIEDDDRHEDDDRDEDQDAIMTEATDAAQKAMEVMDSPEKNKRLKDAVDDYMQELVKSKDKDNEELDDEADLDALEEYDEEEFNFANEGTGEQEEENIKENKEENMEENLVSTKNEDTNMEEP